MIPPILILIRSLSFLQALAYVIAAAVAAFTSYKLEAAVVLGLFLAVLKLFQIVPELAARGLWRRGRDF